MQSPTNVVGKRVGAFVIDSLIVAAITAIAWFALTKQFDGPCFGGGVEINGDCRGFEAGSSNRTIWLLIDILLPIAIFWVYQGMTGKTPGKAMLGIRVVNREGNVPGMLRALGRELMWIVDFWIVALVAALASQNNQRLGDMVAGTYVIDGNYTGAIGAPAGQPAFGAPPPPQGAQPAAWYPDPHGQARLRYWDGERWTEHTSA